VGMPFHQARLGQVAQDNCCVVRKTKYVVGGLAMMMLGSS
jgi:hypothetical protein